MSLTNPELPCQFQRRETVSLIPTANLQHIAIRQLRVGVCLAIQRREPGVPTLFCAIPHILLVRPKEEMSRVHTDRVVAVVANMKRPRIFPVMHSPREAI